MVHLDKFGPIISDRKTGEEIYNLIKSNNPMACEVTIDMSGIKAMATFCAKQIFGKLYIELSPSTFYKNIIISNASEDVRLIIKLAVRDAINDI